MVAACSSPATEPDFPADYAASYTEVRNCRTSSDHDLHHIRILADPVSLATYRDRAAPFPEDSIIVKEEYDFADACAGPILQWTVMRKVGDDWRWQRVDADRSVATEDEPRCINCHAVCGHPPDGFDGTCAMP